MFIYQVIVCILDIFVWYSDALIIINYYLGWVYTAIIFAVET